MKIVLTGGGTGGHIIPNLSLLPYLKKHFDKIYYIGTNGIEKEILQDYKEIEFHEIPAYKVNRKNFLSNLKLPFLLLNSVIKTNKILKEISPDIVFSKGGYVSVPVCLSAFFKKIPIISHESDLTLGKANKLIYKLSTAFCTTFEKTSEGLSKAIYTGSPIRQQLLLGDKEKGKSITKLTSPLPYLLVTGGSTGAVAINQAIYEILPQLTKKFNVIHLVGKGKGKKINYPNYCQMEFCNQIEHLFALSDIVVSRAGSNAIYELLYLNKPMLLIPLPKGTSRGDQVENAKYFEQKKYAKVLYQENLTPKTLLNSIEQLYKEKEKQHTLGFNQNGAKKIVEVIYAVTTKQKTFK